MPGKYDAVSEKLNDVAMNGLAEEEYGSCEEEGFWAALIITDNLFGIIEEDSQGFVEYEVHDSEKDARGRWEDMVREWESLFHPEAAYA
jgi:hypothetical protein